MNSTPKNTEKGLTLEEKYVNLTGLLTSVTERLEVMMETLRRMPALSCWTILISSAIAQKCWKIEQLVPELEGMIVDEMSNFR